MPKLSVVIPVYGVERYIERCARSLFEQTLDDIEYIFIDDCTPDRSVEVLERVLKDYPERAKLTRVEKTPENGNVQKARLFGMKFATGKYFIHCDADDRLDKRMYSLMYEKAKSGDYDYVWCDYFAERPGKKNKLFKQTAAPDRHSLMSGVLSSRLCGAVWNKMIKLSLYKDNALIPPAANMNEDLVMVTQLIYHATSFAHVDEPLYYYYRGNAGSLTADQRGIDACLSKFNSSLANDNIVLGFLKANNLDSEFKVESAILKFYCRDNLRPLTSLKPHYSLWKNTFPEINRSFLFLPRVPFKCKRRFLESLSGCHSLIHSHRFFHEM